MKDPLGGNRGYVGDFLGTGFRLAFRVRVPKIRGTLLEAPIMRTLILCALDWGPPV